MKLILFVCALFLVQTSFSQIGTGQWRLHVSPTEAVDVASGNGLVFAAFPSGLIEYDVAAAESSVWTDVNSLSDVNISTIHFDQSSNAFWVGYTNGNIDKIKENRVTNLPALKLAAIQGNKNINKFIGHNGFIFVSSGLGIMKINPAKDEVVDTYYPNSSMEPILEVAIKGDSIFALTSKKVYKGYLNNIALADPAQWTVDARFPNPGANADYKSIVVYDDDLFITYNKTAFGQDSVYRLTNNQLVMTVGDIYDMEISSLKVIGDKLYVVLQGAVLYFDSSFSVTNSIYQYCEGCSIKSNGVAYYDGIHYIADAVRGLVYYNNVFDNRAINVNGPPKNSFFTLGGSKDKILVAGGTLQQSGFEYNHAGAYSLDNEKWVLFDESTQPLWAGKPIWDVNSVAVNPKNKEEIAIGAYCGLPLTLATGDQITATFSPDNSILEPTSLNNGASCITDIDYDDAGNLWILNGLSNKPLKVRTTDGLWYEFDCGSTAKSKLTGRMVIDYKGNNWFYIRNAGLYGYNHGSDIENPNDDKYKLLTSGTFTGALPSDNVTALAVDFDNEIWIGTDNGFAVLYNSSNIFDAVPGAYNAQRIKLNFEGNVEYLLGSTHITDIEIDGGNRKWMGTANTGIFLLSADGLDILEHFTVENSPLISNVIMDLQINQVTGEMFIVTDKGLLSYRIDASYEDPEYSNVVVFPNPVKPEFMGVVTMQGIKYNSDVKVTDVAGNLVYQTTSNGGTTTWNCKNLNGERVKTGVYLIWTASNDGKGRKVGKVTVIN